MAFLRVLSKVYTGNAEVDRFQDLWMGVLNPLIRKLASLEAGSSIVATTFVQTEQLLGTTATPMPGTANRVWAEIQNLGPNDIFVGPTATSMLRKIPSGQAWSVDFQGTIYGKAATAAQLTGAGTILSELVP